MFSCSFSSLNFTRTVLQTPAVELKSVTPGRRVSGDRMANNEKDTESPLLHRAGSNGKMEQATA